MSTKYPQNKSAPEAAPAPQTDPQKPIPINGFKQVLDMLKVADPAFRESLLKRLAKRDSTLAKSLRRDLGF